MNAHATLSTDLSKAFEKLIECFHVYKKPGMKKITLMHSLRLMHIQDEPLKSSFQEAHFEMNITITLNHQATRHLDSNVLFVSIPILNNY